MLFYTIEGALGTPECSITAQEVFLMDIGNAGSTDYNADPKVVRHMIDNKELLDMQRGHIHSHHSMDVFFSGTDSSELEDNSENYNFYLSLIVNNRGKMTARIAFRATVKSSTVSNITLVGDGSVITSRSEKEQTGTFYYDCDIQLEDGPSEQMVARFQELRERKERATQVGYTYGQPGTVSSSYIKPGRLFENDETIVEKMVEEDEELSTREHENIEIFLAKLVSLNPFFSGRLDTAMNKANYRAFGSSFADTDSEYFQSLRDQIPIQYEDIFKEGLESSPLIIRGIIKRLEEFRPEYPRLVNELLKELKKNIILT